MKIRTAPQIQNVDIGKIPDKTTQAVVRQLLDFIQRNQTYIHDDLADLDKRVTALEP